MAETRKLAASLSDVVGYSRLTGSDEDRTLARLRGDDAADEGESGRVHALRGGWFRV
jgi:hypothetical protein